MAGMFDDLVPKGGDKKSGLSFEDLVRGKPKRTIWDEGVGAMSNFNRGLLVGDELAAAGGVVTGLFTGRHKLTDPAVAAYKQELAAQRAREDDFSARRPNAAALARGTGNALTMAAPVGPGAQAFAEGGVALNALRGATVGGLTAAGAGALDRGSLEERAGAAARGARDPVALGVGAVGGAFATPRAQKPKAAPAPSLDELRTQKGAAYDEVAASGHAFEPAQVQTLAQNIVNDLGSVQISPARHPRAASMMEDIVGLAGEGQPLTLTQLDQIRQVVRRDVINPGDEAEAFMGQRVIAQIDKFIDDVGGEAGDTLRSARDLNTRVRKLEKLDGLDDAAADRAAATGKGGNIDNATRQNVIRFRDKTPNLTPAEREAADRVIQGLPVQNALRLAGGLSPENGMLSLGGNLLTAGATGGGSLAVTGASIVAKRVADALTARNVQALRDIIARGGEEAAMVTQALADPAYVELRQQLANDLAAQAGVQGASAQGAAAFGGSR